MNTNNYTDQLNELGQEKRTEYDEIHTIHKLVLDNGIRKSQCRKKGLVPKLELLKRRGSVVDSTKGFWRWKEPSYNASSQAISYLAKEREVIAKVQEALKNSEKGEQEEIIRSCGYDALDFLVKELIIKSGKFNDCNYGFFLHEKEIGNYLKSLHDDDDFFLLDVASDGRYDGGIPYDFHM